MVDEDRRGARRRAARARPSACSASRSSPRPTTCATRRRSTSSAGSRRAGARVRAYDPVAMPSAAQASCPSVDALRGRLRGLRGRGRAGDRHRVEPVPHARPRAHASRCCARPVVVDLRNIYEPGPMRAGRLRVRQRRALESVQGPRRSPSARCASAASPASPRCAKLRPTSESASCMSRLRASTRSSWRRGGRALLAARRAPRGRSRSCASPAARTLLDATLARARRCRGPRRRLAGLRRRARGGDPPRGAARARRACWSSRARATPRRRSRWAALRIAAHDPEAVMAGAAGRPPHPRRARVRAAVAARGARRGRARGALVTLGIEPTRPETGYGYIRARAPRGPRASRVFIRVRALRREARRRARARRFLRQRRLPVERRASSSGRARAILEELERCMPELRRARWSRSRAAARGAGRARRSRAPIAARPAVPIDTGGAGAQPRASGRCRCAVALERRRHLGLAGRASSASRPARSGSSQGDLVFDDAGGNSCGARRAAGRAARRRGTGGGRQPATRCWSRGWTRAAPCANRERAARTRADRT